MLWQVCRRKENLGRRVERCVWYVSMCRLTCTLFGWENYENPIMLIVFKERYARASTSNSNANTVQINKAGGPQAESLTCLC